MLFNLLCDVKTLLACLEAAHKLNVPPITSDRSNLERLPTAVLVPRDSVFHVHLLYAPGVDVHVPGPGYGAVAHPDLFPVETHISSIQPTGDDVVRQPDADTDMQKREQRSKHVILHDTRVPVE